MKPVRVVVVGGGITGLTAAYTLERESECDVVLLENEHRLGGKVRTQSIPCNGSTLLVEDGADSLFTHKPWALELALELGLSREIIEPEANEFSMLIGGKLHRVPRGLAALTRPDPEALNQADFLSEEAKNEVLNERHVPAAQGEDESIGSFFRRRFGQEFSRLVAEPLLAGTHGGSPHKLSIRALYPSYFEMERKFGSLSRGVEEARNAAERSTGEPSVSQKPSFVSFRHGMGTLVEALANSLERTSVLLNTRAVSLDKSDSAYTVLGQNGREWTADHVILATPSFAAAKMVESLNRKAASLLAEIRHASAAVVTLGYEAEIIPGGLTGTGFLVPHQEDFPVTGGTWSSVKWPGRAHADLILVRLFLGRETGIDLTLADDERWMELAQGAFEKLVLPQGTPIFKRMQRWALGLPQYDVGHLERLYGIDAALTPLRGLHLAGTSYRGVGIPDCVRQGREVARTVIKEIINQS